MPPRPTLSEADLCRGLPTRKTLAPPGMRDALMARTNAGISLRPIDERIGRPHDAGLVRLAYGAQRHDLTSAGIEPRRVAILAKLVTPAR
jgi:hypothetical protein